MSAILARDGTVLPASHLKIRLDFESRSTKRRPNSVEDRRLVCKAYEIATSPLAITAPCFVGLRFPERARPTSSNVSEQIAVKLDALAGVRSRRRTRDRLDGTGGCAVKGFIEGECRTLLTSAAPARKWC